MHNLLLDMADADTRVEFGMAEAEFAQRTQWRASAEVFRAIDATLREAAEHPEVFIDAAMLRGDAVEFAERAAAADLAVRLSLAESTVRAYGMVAQTLRPRLPLLWACFAEGDVSTQNAREAASIVSELPSDLWAEFETKIIGAITLAPARFRARARAIREKLQAQTLTERHEAALAHRGVWAEVDCDGMGWLHAHLSAEKLAMGGAPSMASRSGCSPNPMKIARWPSCAPTCSATCSPATAAHAQAAPAAAAQEAPVALARAALARAALARVAHPRGRQSGLRSR